MTELDCQTDADALALRSVGHDDAAKTVLLVCPTMWDETEIPRIVRGFWVMGMTRFGPKPSFVRIRRARLRARSATVSD